MQAVSSCTNEKADKFQMVCEILKRYHYRPEKLIPILQEVQNEYRYLPESVERFMNADQMQAEMEKAGLIAVQRRLMAMGAVCAFVGRKAEQGEQGD